MPNYDMRCNTCDVTFEDMILKYEEAKTITCPVCSSLLSIVPSRFGFEVKGSKRTERQMLEARFDRRAKRIKKQFTKAEQDRFDNFCRNRNLRRYY